MSNKRKRIVLTMEQKTEILAKLDKGETCVALARHYNIGKATVSDIKNNRHAIMDFASQMDGRDGMKRRKVMKAAKNQDLDKAMGMWFIQKRSLNEPISGPLICKKALEMNSKLGGPEDFKASNGWLHKFKSRHGIRELQVQEELLSAGSSGAEIFKETLRLFVEKEGYSEDAVYNADESVLNWKALPRKSLASCQELAACGFEVSKERVTIMTCTNAAGTHKLPLLLIGKSKKPHCFKNIKSLPVTYATQKNASMDSKLFLNWFENDFIINVKKWRQDHYKTGKVLLLLDNAPSHPSAEVLNSIDTDFQVMFFPPNVTSLIQYMDQGVMKKFKRMYQKQMLRRLSLNEGTEENVVAYDIPGFQDCNYDDAVDWLGTDATDLGYQTLEDGEIVCSLQNQSGDEESDKRGPSSAEAFAAFETGLEWFEKQSECCPSQLHLLKRLRDLAAEKRIPTCRQMNMDNLVKKI